ncbi:maleate cis-trans isomerase family protein [Rhodoplanes sp. Z2-YC6860]|uniref:maleate cis-trans isomerase family protein n=1 Tax=Rhodoplanes sp. Z2-YC6860 TaxID=674703 RepID=UPI00078EC65E|nr:aspartate/glutamate racemase family protein [Rhodoplanes sp. Z2-YC6860]AMN43553.1 maleate cis-trans isomerase [Rhodoplanes sp. Z2-YC6860]
MPTAAVQSASLARRGFLATPLARIGLIIPSSNRLTEPQLRHFAPPELGIHVTRLQMTGQWNRPLSALGDDIKRAAGALADAKVDIVVFHCTGHAMEEGPDGDARTRALIESATGIKALSTASAIQEALAALKLKRLILLTPYDQETNDHEIDYLRQIGLSVVHDVALALPGSDDYLAQPPERWVELAVEHAREEVDGYFLSCTNTTQIEAIEPIERRLGKPVINSNQAVLWACTQRLRPKLGNASLGAGLGRLVNGS